MFIHSAPTECPVHTLQYPRGRYRRYRSVLVQGLVLRLTCHFELTNAFQLGLSWDKEQRLFLL